MSQLFSSFKLRNLEFKNRIFVSPMCQYSCENGMPNEWHLVHLGSRAVGGAALVMVEASAVSPEGRISPADCGIWNDEQAKAFLPITKFIKDNDSVPAIQLAHAGRKASMSAPWTGSGLVPPEKGGWIPIAPSSVKFHSDYSLPHEMSVDDIKKTTQNFVMATQRSLDAGFEVVEIHMAHGYLLHEFLSPLSNHRQDEYGGSLENRMRFPLEVAKAVRDLWPQHLPVFVRISATDWKENGWDLPQSVAFCRELKKLGIDFIDCSTGGNVADAKIPVGPGYQVSFADSIRKEVGILTGAVGLITEAKQAEDILVNQQADVVLLARELLRDPYWPLHAAHELKADVTWPKQYERAKPR